MPHPHHCSQEVSSGGSLSIKTKIITHQFHYDYAPDAGKVIIKRQLSPYHGAFSSQYLKLLDSVCRSFIFHQLIPNGNLSLVHRRMLDMHTNARPKIRHCKANATIKCGASSSVHQAVYLAVGIILNLHNPFFPWPFHRISCMYEAHTHTHRERKKIYKLFPGIQKHSL